MRATFPAAFLLSASCLQIGTGTGTDPGTDAGSVPVSSLAAGNDAGFTGENCFADPATQVVLCQTVDACPGAPVDPDLFPNCGYAMRGGSQLDLECLCGTALCPIGVPASCAQAKTLLDAQSAFVVCGQQDEGRCLELVAPEAGPRGMCDPSCRDECAGAPDCIQLCGC
jgi:hypothetical protein